MMDDRLHHIEALASNVRARARLARLVGLTTPWHEIPPAAQNALYGLAAELDDVAAVLAGVSASPQPDLGTRGQFPHPANSTCAGCPSCQPERFPNASAVLPANTGLGSAKASVSEHDAATTEVDDG